jgi:hypothetical protein
MLNKAGSLVSCVICTAESDPRNQQFAGSSETNTAAMQGELRQDYTWCHSPVKQTSKLKAVPELALRCNL